MVDVEARECVESACNQSQGFFERRATMFIRVALQVFDGPETDDLPHDTGEEMREVTTQRILDFEVVNGSG